MPSTASIIIPTYYRTEALRNAIESALNQTYTTIEVIVVDDSGERFAEDTVADYDITYIAHQRNRGGNPARNTGIEASDGSYIQLLDDDDVLSPEKIERQIELLNSSPSVGVAYCGVETRNGKCLPNSAVQGDVLRDFLQLDMFPCYTSSMLIERRVFEQILPLSSRPSADDIGMLLELAQITEFDFLDEVLVQKAFSPHSRGAGYKNVVEKEQIITEEYSHLYDIFSSEVETIAERKLGRQFAETCYLILSRKPWSATAVQAGWKGLRYNLSIVTLAIFVLSLFGKPALIPAGSLYKRIFGRGLT